LGQAVAELPVSLGLEIKHTPDAGGEVQQALAFIAHCHVYLMVLGADFAAPMGLEWERALKTNRLVLAYRKDGRHSPSARSLLRRSQVAWTEFQSPRELKGRVTRALAQLLLDRGERFGLHLKDVEGLLLEAVQEKEETPVDPTRHHGAGHGGVILGRD
jgi:hypothetical protein